MTPKKVKDLVIPISVPVGGIIMWSGTQNDIPTGWHLCDGTNGTPDLRNRFVMGAGSSYNPGATGGASSVSLSVSNMPSHSHSGSINCGVRRNSTQANVGKGLSTSGDWGVTYTDLYQFNTAAPYATDTKGSGSSFNILNPYYALCFIMLIGSQNT